MAQSTPRSLSSGLRTMTPAAMSLAVMPSHSLSSPIRLRQPLQATLSVSLLASAARYTLACAIKQASRLAQTVPARSLRRVVERVLLAEQSLACAVSLTMNQLWAASTRIARLTGSTTSSTASLSTGACTQSLPMETQAATKTTLSGKCSQAKSKMGNAN